MRIIGREIYRAETQPKKGGRKFRNILIRKSTQFFGSSTFFFWAKNLFNGKTREITSGFLNASIYLEFYEKRRKSGKNNACNNLAVVAGEVVKRIDGQIDA